MPTRFTVGGRGDKIHFFDSAHQATDYGWHIVDGNGLPYAHAFAAQSIANGSGWITGTDPISATASHEALEMLGDPAANEYCFDGDERLWSREVCDPVQEDTYGIMAGGMKVLVSNFVLPAYFNPWAPGPYDHLGVLEKPFSLAKGGYAVFERAHGGPRAVRQALRRHVRRRTARVAAPPEAGGLGSHVLAARAGTERRPS